MNVYQMSMVAVMGLCVGAAGQDTHRKEFLVGGDISMLSRIGELGGVYREGGKQSDPLKIFKKYGWNCYRLRLFVNPTYRNAVVNDLPYTLALAERIRVHGAKLLLNFHYSDTWADPGHQRKPAAWRDLDFDSLENKVREYTASVITEFSAKGVLPEMVQIGNEVTPGMLWPDGKIGREGDVEAQWERFTRLLKAGIDGVREPLADGQSVRIMIHIDSGGNRQMTKWFFDNVIERDVPFDIIGLSYYPWWHGTMDALRDNLHATAKAYGKDIMVVETAYPHHGRFTQKPGDWSHERMAWPISPQGQRAFLVELIKTVRRTTDGRGIGVLYWYPESIPVEGLRVWCEGVMALFDEHGKALPAVKAFQP